MTGNIQIGKTLNLDGTTKIVTIQTTSPEYSIDKKVIYIQIPVTKQNWANLPVTKAIDLKQLNETLTIKGELDPVDESVSTLLDGTITDSTTTIVVSSTTNFDSAPGYILIENEVIGYTGTSSTSFTGCTRGARGTIAANHTDNSSPAGSMTRTVTVYRYDDSPENLKKIIKDGGKTKIGNNNITPSNPPTAANITSMKYNDDDSYYVNFDKFSMTEVVSDNSLLFDITLSCKKCTDLGD